METSEAWSKNKVQPKKQKFLRKTLAKLTLLPVMRTTYRLKVAFGKSVRLQKKSIYDKIDANFSKSKDRAAKEDVDLLCPKLPQAIKQS